MIEDERTSPSAGGYGHNSGASLEAMRAEQAAALRDTMREGKTWEERKREFLTSASRQIVTDRVSAAGAADTIRLAGQVRDAIMQDRQQRTDPYYRIHRELSAMANEFWDPVDQAMMGLKGQIDTWSAEEDDRIKQQEAEQAAMIASLRAGKAAPVIVREEVDDQREPAGRAYLDYTAPTAAVQSTAPAMRPAAKKRIRGDLGSTISSIEQTEYEIEDLSMIPAHIMTSPVVTEAILSVVKKTAKALGVPAGIRVVRANATRVS